ncbi:hypothetical protein [Oxynema aestuarii]|uniref:Uncharacterized protein n=1 Tax=Oxynema aestuarii AP17 TaxID=2064643 RepID=A0A6H1TT36_9CYAN|nr:hypothetical protein [Oxynema aestuarii]QIZ69605.1 hypothetical protein HCG48_02560 [Oxynema aestuarii AP17]
MNESAPLVDYSGINCPWLEIEQPAVSRSRATRAKRLATASPLWRQPRRLAIARAGGYERSSRRR